MAGRSGPHRRRERGAVRDAARHAAFSVAAMAPRSYSRRCSFLICVPLSSPANISGLPWFSLLSISTSISVLTYSRSLLLYFHFSICSRPHFPFKLISITYLLPFLLGPFFLKYLQKRVTGHSLPLFPRIPSRAHTSPAQSSRRRGGVRVRRRAPAIQLGRRQVSLCPAETCLGQTT